MQGRVWTEKDWRVRELLRSAKSIEELFHAYKENKEHILGNLQLLRFVFRVFYYKFYTGFGSLVWANQQLWGLPDSDPVRKGIGHDLVSQIGINYSFKSAF